MQQQPQLCHNVSALRLTVLKALQQAAGYSELQAATGATEAYAIFMQERQRVVLYDGVLDVLSQLAGHYRLGALTNGNADIYKTDAASYFDFALLAENVGRAKPAPDMFETALEQAGVSAREAIHVGDHIEHDIAGAKAVGMHTIWLNQVGACLDDSQPPDQEVHSLQELPTAVAAIATTVDNR